MGPDCFFARLQDVGVFTSNSVMKFISKMNCRRFNPKIR